MRINQVAIKHGFRSGLEDNVNDMLKEHNKSFSYESEKISYIQPETKHNYTPDFVLNKIDGNKMYVETKGRWVKTDRLKFDLIFEQYSDIDIRFVFQNPNAKLYKGSKTTYVSIVIRKVGSGQKKTYHMIG